MKKISLVSLPKSTITKFIPSCKTRKELLLKLGYKSNGGTRKALKMICDKYNIDLSIFDAKLTAAKYCEHPKYCKNCGKVIPYEKRLNNFCNSSCSASFNNKERHLSLETRQKISEAVQKKSPRFNGDIKIVTNFPTKEHHCKNCGKRLLSRQKLYCSHGCRQEGERIGYIKRWKNGEEKGLKGEYGISNCIRWYLFNKFNYKCQCCGWGERNKFTGVVPLEIHHIDGDYTNNREENLQLLCPNCHALTETYKAHNKNGRKNRKKYY